ncbi:MAG: serine/threonine protein kinase, partial [Deltaproteobacteria bacterium]|nr:serine/threonine protein kinase [Deltaproteobacteria bacterium]
MSDPITIRPGNEPSLDSSWVRTWTSRFTLPPDLVEQARRRLGYLALAFGTMPLVFYPIAVLSFTGFDRVAAVAVACTVVVSFALFYATRSERFSDAVVLLFGLVFEVLLCLSAGTFVEWDTYQLTGSGPQLTFAAVIIVVFPLIVPATPWLTLVTSLIAASTAPLVLYIMHWLGAIEQPLLADLIEVGIGPFACVVLAYMGSRVIHNIGAELVRARQLGSYTLEELLGRGGMGEVWRARHRMLSRPAAIKLIKSEALGEDPSAARSLIRRFELEAQTTASLRSPHTVELYDFGTSPEGTFYYVMELLDGIDLQAFVEKHGALPARRVVYLLRQVCHSLDEAHARGLVHRDIKPSNIFVGRYGRDTDFVKVLDFGLVKHSDPAGPDLESNLTQRGSVLGTPAFIAPEMVMSGPGIDARVDIYALGCVAYWLRTGAHVFLSKSPMEAVVHHVKDQPEAPSSRAELDIPEALDALVLACLEKDPGKRPQSADDLSQRLQAVAFDSPWAEQDARRWWDRTYPEASVAIAAEP